MDVVSTCCSGLALSFGFEFPLHPGGCFWLACLAGVCSAGCALDTSDELVSNATLNKIPAYGLTRTMLPITNRGRSPLRLQNTFRPCRIELKQTELFLRPGETVEVPVIIDSRGTDSDFRERVVFRSDFGKQFYVDVGITLVSSIKVNPANLQAGSATADILRMEVIVDGSRVSSLRPAQNEMFTLATRFETESRVVLAAKLKRPLPSGGYETEIQFLVEGFPKTIFSVPVRFELSRVYHVEQAEVNFGLIHTTQTRLVQIGGAAISSPRLGKTAPGVSARYSNSCIEITVDPSKFRTQVLSTSVDLETGNQSEPILRLHVFAARMSGPKVK